MNFIKKHIAINRLRKIWRILKGLSHSFRLIIFHPYLRLWELTPQHQVKYTLPLRAKSVERENLSIEGKFSFKGWSVETCALLLSTIGGCRITYQTILLKDGWLAFLKSGLSVHYPLMSYRAISALLIFFIIIFCLIILIMCTYSVILC